MENAKILTVDCEITKESFKDKEGKEIEFNACYLLIGGQRIKVAPSLQNKGLFNYIVNDLFKK